MRAAGAWRVRLWTAVAMMVLPAASTAQEAISLFNGRDLTGWTVHGTELWYVEDGELVCESGPDAARIFQAVWE